MPAYGLLWTESSGTITENIIKYGETEKEILEAVKEQVTGISFDSFEDSYWEMISDPENGNEELAENRGTAPQIHYQSHDGRQVQGTGQKTI